MQPNLFVGIFLYENMMSGKISPFSAPCGAEVTGVDFSKPVKKRFRQITQPSLCEALCLGSPESEVNPTTDGCGCRLFWINF